MELTPEQSKLVEDNIKLASNLAWRQAKQLPPSRTVDVDELRGVALLALCDAAKRYHQRGNVPFGAYATLRVRGALVDFLRLSCRADGLLRPRKGRPVAEPVRTSSERTLEALTEPKRTPDRYDDAHDLCRALRKLPHREAMFIVRWAQGEQITTLANELYSRMRMRKGMSQSGGSMMKRQALEWLREILS